MLRDKQILIETFAKKLGLKVPARYDKFNKVLLKLFRNLPLSTKTLKCPINVIGVFFFINHRTSIKVSLKVKQKNSHLKACCDCVRVCACVRERGIERGCKEKERILR